MTVSLGAKNFSASLFQSPVFSKIPLRVGYVLVFPLNLQNSSLFPDTVSEHLQTPFGNEFSPTAHQFFASLQCLKDQRRNEQMDSEQTSVKVKVSTGSMTFLSRSKAITLGLASEKCNIFKLILHKT